MLRKNCFHWISDHCESFPNLGRRLSGVVLYVFMQIEESKIAKFLAMPGEN